MKKLTIIILSLLLIFTLAGCMDRPNNGEAEPVEDFHTAFHLDSNYTTNTLLVESALRSQIDEEKLIQVYEEDMIDGGYTACIIYYPGEDRGIYLTEGLIEEEIKFENGEYAGHTPKTVQYTIDDGELVEIK